MPWTGIWDLFVAKFDPDGGYLWGHSFEGTTWSYPSVDTDLNNNIVVVGMYTTSITIGGVTHPGTNNCGYYVAKFDSEGDYLWSRGYEAYDDFIVNSDVDIDYMGNILITGDMRGSADFGGGLLSSYGWDDVLVVKLNSDGNHVWSQNFGENDFEHGKSIAADPSGNVFLYGTFMDVVNFGGEDLVSPSTYNLYLVKFSNPPVATTVQAVTPMWAGDHVEVSWRLHDEGANLSFNVLRKTAGQTFTPLLHPNISRRGSEYVLSDNEIERGRAYFYRVEILESNMLVTSFEAQVTTPPLFTRLAQNFPNPFNLSTRISYDLAATGRVTLNIYDVNGRLIQTLVDRIESAGIKSITWNGYINKNKPAPAGIYIYKLTAPGFAETRRMVLIR